MRLRLLVGAIQRHGHFEARLLSGNTQFRLPQVIG